MSPTIGFDAVLARQDGLSKLVESLKALLPEPPREIAALREGPTLPPGPNIYSRPFFSAGHEREAPTANGGGLSLPKR